jgi:hypothetical protein
MRLDLARLPTDPILLHRVVRDLTVVLERQDAEIETLRRLVTSLQRRQFGRSPEKHHPDQLALGLEAIEEQIGAVDAEVPATVSPSAAARAPRRKPLPAPSART